jgi:outer membrane protein assembly factor BamB
MIFILKTSMKKFILNKSFGHFLFLLILCSSLLGVFLYQGIYKHKNFSEVIAQAADCTASDTANWCQLQRDPQHSGYVPVSISVNYSQADYNRFQIVYRHPFPNERIHSQIQPIIFQGKVIIPTDMGNVYAVNAGTAASPGTGNQLWKYVAGAPIYGSVIAGLDSQARAMLYFATALGDVVALDVSGNQVWKVKLGSRLGFSTTPVLAENKIFIGSREGIFYALNSDNGQVLWQYSTGANIMQTAAYNNGRVFFGGMDMRLYALNTSNGSLAWRTNKIPQMAFKDYYPVITSGKVVVRPMGNGQIGGSTPFDNQDGFLTDYVANPQNYRKSLLFFNESDGQESPSSVIHWDLQTMNGATVPPCVDRSGSTEYLVVPVPRVSGGSAGYSAGWGRLNISTRKIFDAFGTDVGCTDTVCNGYGNGDETTASTCTASGVFVFQSEESQFGAAWTGYYDFTKSTGSCNTCGGTWTKINFDEVSNPNMLISTSMGGGASAVSVANGLVYHIANNELVVRKP